MASACDAETLPLLHRAIILELCETRFLSDEFILVACDVACHVACQVACHVACNVACHVACVVACEKMFK